MMFYRYRSFFILLILLLTTACAGATATPAPSATAAAPILVPQVTVAPATQTPSPLPSAAPTETTLPSPTPLPVYSLGQLVQVSGLSLAVIKVDFSNQQAAVTLAAISSSPGFQSITAGQFLALSTGAKLVQSPCPADSPSFKDDLQPGDILSGTICWNGGSVDSPLRIEYRDLTNGLLAAWEFPKAGEVPVPAELAAPDLKIAVHPLGDAVLYQGLTVTVALEKMTTSVVKEFHTTYARVHLTFANKSASDVTLSKNIMADIRVKSANGENMWQVMVSRDCDLPFSADITVQPGQSYKVLACFGTFGTSPQPGGRVILAYDAPTNQAGFINWMIK